LSESHAPVLQVVQHLRDGTIELLQLPGASPGPREVLVRTRRSLLSAGTERMLLEFGRAGLIGKARQQPERVRLLLDRLRTDGVGPVLEAAFTKLDEPLPLGYANVGTVMAVGSGVQEFQPGDRVVSNAPHASWARVSANLCARVPQNVSDDAAAFVVPAAIGLQGIRLAAPTMGETFAVIGSGLIGLLTVQLLNAAGCDVIAVDTRADRLELARAAGARTVLAGAGVDVAAAVMDLTGGRGADGVLIAAATDSDDLVRDAAHMSRKRGRLILIGVAGLRLARADFYAKELSLQVSCSYGPGRYDPQYEGRGQDYPLAYVRWTEQRNFEAVLEQLAKGRLQVEGLISHRFGLPQAPQAYEALIGDSTALGILLTYEGGSSPQGEVPRPPATLQLPRRFARQASARAPRVAVIGAGNYARRFLLPVLRDGGADLKVLVSSGSALSGWAAKRTGFAAISTDAAAALSDPDVDAVIIATRHDTHARYVCDALAAGKQVFVEKPLALSEAELDSVGAAYESACGRGAAPVLMVGFNRRFAPLSLDLKRRVASLPGARCLVYTVNAGQVASEHWSHEPAVGGGRIVGEVCHFIDLLRFLTGAPIVSVDTLALPGAAGGLSESASIALRFADDSVGTVHYFANGARAFPKERVEVFGGNNTLVLNNFRRLEAYASPGFGMRLPARQDKGNRACLQAFLSAVRAGGENPMPFPEILEVSRATLAAARQAAAPS
jgi:predicted dehydrogenase/threonine dehydrogenase-like Zn-dependent dehydrogenase